MKMDAGVGRVVVLSDLHMGRVGRGAGSADAVRGLWRGAERVVLNGDTAETRNKRRRDEAHRRVEELKRAAAEDGVELVLVAGNHDPNVSEVDWVELCGGAVVATHGDILHLAVAPWSDVDGRLEGESREALAGLGATAQGADLATRAEAIKRASARHWRKTMQGRYEKRERGVAGRWAVKAQKASLVLYYWWAMPRRAMRFAEAEFSECAVFVFGHIHRPGVWVDRAARGGRGRVVLNTGAFRLPKRPRAVVIEGGEAAMYKVVGGAGRGFRLGKAVYRGAF
ncbi:MAG: metallophosphoesterase family protein [Planctomycetota bacterium]